MALLRGSAYPPSFDGRRPRRAGDSIKSDGRGDAVDDRHRVPRRQLGREIDHARAAEHDCLAPVLALGRLDLSAPSAPRS